MTAAGCKHCSLQYSLKVLSSYQPDRKGLLSQLEGAFVPVGKGFCLNCKGLLSQVEGAFVPTGRVYVPIGISCSFYAFMHDQVTTFMVQYNVHMLYKVSMICRELEGDSR